MTTPPQPAPPTGPTTSGATALRFRVGAVPVQVDASVVLLLTVLGLRSGSVTAIVIWVVVGLLSLLVHELGHAAVASMGGARPTIRLAGLGGVTTYRATPRLQRRTWALTVALAGPLTGLASWVLLRELRATWAPVEAIPATALAIAESMALVWSLVNLLPILPMDGGKALLQLMPGTPLQRLRRTAATGVAVGVTAVGAALLLDAPYAAVIAAFMSFRNAQALRRTAPEEDAAARAAAAGADPVTVAAAADDWDEVRRLLLAGYGSPEAALAAARAAGEQGAHDDVARIAQLAADRGWHDHRLAWAAARARVALGEHDRAVAWVELALELGAEPSAVRADGALAPLRAHPRWPLPRR